MGVRGTGAVMWGAMLCALALAFFFELSFGSVSIPLKAVVSIMLGQADMPEDWQQIVLLFRLPRALTAMLGGAALAIAGLKMQTLFRNPLADPFVLGISSGAGLGVALVVMAIGGLRWNLFLEKAGLAGNVSLVLSAIAGAGAVLAVVLGVARRVEGNVTLLIVGLMFGYITGAVVQILMQFAVEHQMQSYITWTFGSFGSVTWRQLAVFAPTVACGLAIAGVLVKPLNALLLGNDYARSMGVNVRVVRFWIIGGASVLAGAVTAYCGPVGFLGIAVPHLGRILLKTSDHRKLVPAVILLGALVALLADLISQMPGTQMAMPLNAVTALIGAPVVVGVIMRRHHVMEAGS
ncbi:MAG: Hemin transport system permease protein HmuU [Syntrophorhabdaceae bacterium PtaU1.Bin034]|nr:MAG: Hemin transport system permease protein HmuU [Syntrophorhabdaceae bacterium PtaU1.Bin034]